VIPRGDLGHGAADPFDDARAFVAQHGGKRDGIPLIAHDQVGVTDPRGGDAYPHLAGLGILDINRLDREGRAQLLCDCCLDSHVPFSVDPGETRIRSDLLVYCVALGATAARTSAR
jgi:hypothetical protein